MFRDSRGVVHTVCSPDPLRDVPAGAATALLTALVVTPVNALDRQAQERLCEAAVELLERWQDAFFAALPEAVDLDEEAAAAAEAGVSLAEIEAELALDDPLLDESLLDDPVLDDALQDDPVLDDPVLDDGVDVGPDDAAALLDDVDAELDALVELAEREGPDDPRRVLPAELVAVLERELLLLPLRSRLESLVAAVDLVSSWADLLADHEKLLGHLVLAHGCRPVDTAHDALVDAHGAQHRSTGPGHLAGP